MRALNRRGFTLIELLIAMVIGAIVGTATVRIILGTQRATEAGIQRVGIQQTMRAGIGYMTNVLRELDAADGDIGVANATRLEFRSMRWASPLCAQPLASGTSVFLLIDASSVYGLRRPDAVQDSVLVFAETDAGKRSDDAWLVGAVTAVGAGNCSNGSNAVALTVDITAGSGGQAAALANVTPGAPVRGFQQEELSLFQGADSRWWMGQRTANRAGSWTNVQALVGPLAVGGLALQYFDSTGTITGTLTDIASVGIVLRAESSTRVRTQATDIDFARDSLISRVALRNNPRF